MAEALTFDRKKLIKALEDKLAERVADREAAAKEREDAEAESLQKLIDVLDKYPEAVVQCVSSLRNYLGEADGLMEAADAYWGNAPRDTYDHDASLNQMIRVYKLASDEAVTLTPDDTAIHYI